MVAGVGPERRAKMNEQESKKRRGPRTPNNHTTTGFRISNELWAVLQPLLPHSLNTHRFGGGRPRVSDRQCADAIFYVLRTGCECAFDSARADAQEWVRAGVFLKLWQAGVIQFDELCGINGDWLSMDGAMSHPLRWAEKKLGPTRLIVARVV